MHVLAAHPSTPNPAWNVSALAERTADGDLRLRYVLRGPLDALRLAPPGPVRRGARLWEHTCAEAFVGAEDAPDYVELNVAPSREWDAYAFRTYRVGERAPTLARAPRIVVRRGDDALAIDAAVGLADLGVPRTSTTLRVGLTVVVEARDGRLSYWALHHPSATPDFHHPDGFTLRLAERGAAP